MGILNGIVNKLSEMAKARNQEIERYKRMYKDYDDERLIRRFKESSGNQKCAILQLLRERGYGNPNDD